MKVNFAFDILPMLSLLIILTSLSHGLNYYRSNLDTLLEESDDIIFQELQNELYGIKRMARKTAKFGKRSYLFDLFRPNSTEEEACLINELNDYCLEVFDLRTDSVNGSFYHQASEKINRIRKLLDYETKRWKKEYYDNEIIIYAAKETRDQIELELYAIKSYKKNNKIIKNKEGSIISTYTPFESSIDPSSIQRP